MRFKYEDFPLNQEPVYDFYIADNAQLRVRKHFRYEIETSPRGRKTYRIHTGANIVTKREDQMDRVLAGHVFTINYDPELVLELMLKRADADAAKAADMLNAAKVYKDRVKMAIRKDVVEETYGTVMEQKPKRAWTPIDAKT